MDKGNYAEISCLNDETPITGVAIKTKRYLDEISKREKFIIPLLMLRRNIYLFKTKVILR